MRQVVKATALSKVYFLGKTLVNALSNVDLDVQKGEFLAIVGPSGSGKTTLLNLIGCLDQPTKGRIEISGQDVTHMKSDQLADIRNREIGFIFQTFNLIPVLTAYENVEFPLLLGNCSPKDRRKRVYKALEEVGIAEQQKHRPDELSGGQRQRVAIARALVKDPMIILADEPTANLDSATGDNIIKQMLEINRQRGTSFVFATHDPMVMKHASTIIKLHDGRRQDHGIY